MKLARADFARAVRRARQATGLTQLVFADRFRIGLPRLRDWEQGRFSPDSVSVAYMQLIARNPKAVEQALASSAWPQEEAASA